MLGRYQIDVVHSSDVLKLDIPISKFLCGQVLSISLMCNVMILTEHTAKIATGEENTSRAIMALYTRLCKRKYQHRKEPDSDC